MSGPAVDGYHHGLRVPTRWHDNDAFGHLNNTVYYALMDTTVTSWLLQDAGIDVFGGDLMAVVASSSCEYRVSAAFPDVLLVGLRAARVGRTSITWEFGLVRERDGVQVATGRWVHVVCAKATGAPQPLPAALRERAEALLVPEPRPA